MKSLQCTLYGIKRQKKKAAIDTQKMGMMKRKTTDIRGKNPLNDTEPALLNS